MNGGAGWSVAWPDDRFWVRLGSTSDPKIRWRIDGSAHTHRGHLRVCAIGRDDVHRSVSLADVVEVSADAGVWLAGFLHGQEVELIDFMGGSDDALEAAEDNDVVRWRNWNEQFRMLGYEPSPVNTAPPAVPELNELDHPRPWTFVAGQYQVWTSESWVVEVQPTLSDARWPGWTWPGTRCEARGHHSMEQHGQVSVCEDCHLVT